MWDKLTLVHGEYENVLRAKEEILRGKYDEMKMKDVETIMRYFNITKEVVGAIKASRGTINNEEVVSKVLRTLLHIYAIRVYAI